MVARRSTMSSFRDLDKQMRPMIRDFDIRKYRKGDPALVQGDMTIERTEKGVSVTFKKVYMYVLFFWPCNYKKSTMTRHIISVC